MNKLCFLFIGLFLILAGCASYRIGNESFGSSHEALQRQTDNLTNILNKITPTDQAAHGTALVIIPSDGEIQKNYIRLTNPTRLGKEQVDYVVTATKNNIHLVADGIRKRGIFDTVAVERHNGNPASYPIGDYDYLVFADIDGWFIKGKNTLQPLPLPIDKNIPDFASRLLAFLDLLCQQAKSLQGRS